MRGYERISEGSSRAGLNGQDVHEEVGLRNTLRSPGGQVQDGETRRSKLNAAVSLGVIAVVGALAVVSSLHQHQQRHQQQQQQESATADFGSRHAGVAVSVFETSMRTGARLDQSFPSAAGLKEECSSAADSDDDDSSSDDSSDSDDEGPGPKICPEKSTFGTVVVQSKEKRQSIIGFGGAFTDAATINFYKLPKDVQEKVLDMYFGPDGIEYTLGRVPMNSCDFSVETYSFDDVPGDYNLTHFDDGVERDSAQRIPMILSAVERREDLKIFTSPWSPPAWMKEPRDGAQDMVRSAMPQGLLPDPKVHAAWALFFSRFISAYKEQGVDMWGLTIQNESENAGPWEACVYTPSSQASFLRDHLGPVIRRDHPDVRIMAFDHNRDHLVPWAREMMLDEGAAQYLDGMAFHWYFATGDRLMDGSQGWGALNMTKAILSEDKFILSTENCNCPNVEHSLEGGWKRAEHVAHDMIADVNSWSTGWVDWNLMLDYDGGPNHAGNLCDSPVVANKNHTDVIFQPMFYYMGHMTKFAQPGATLLKSHVTGVYQKGGGGPAGVVPGYEATLYGCEGSVRQTWEMSATGKIALADYYGAEYSWYSPLCVSRRLVKNMLSVFLVPCDSEEAGTFKHDPESGRLVLQPNTLPANPDISSVEPTPPPSPVPPTQTGGEAGQPKTHTAAPPPTEEGLCLDVLNESTDDGAVLTLTPCVADDAPEGSGGEFQKWEFSEVEGGAGEGSLVSATSGRCVTAGWPFFTGAAFEMSEASKVRYGKEYSVVLLNEAEEPVEFDLSFPSEGFTVRAIIGPRSIQTILA